VTTPPQAESSPWDSWYAPRRPTPPPSEPQGSPQSWSGPQGSPQSWSGPPGGPQSWPAPPGGAQPAPAGPDATRADPWGRPDAWGLEPAGDPSTELLGDLQLGPAPGGPQRRGLRQRLGFPQRMNGQQNMNGPQRTGGRRRLGGRLVPVTAAVVLMAIVAGLIAVRALSGSAAASGTPGATPSASSPEARRQAAVGLAGLLAQSVTDRADVTGAAEDVRGCGPSLRQDARIFTRAASSRQHLLSRLATLPGRSLLPAAMLADLTSAWQASAQVDTDLAQWTQDNIARGCHGHGRSDAHLRASAIPEGRATLSKRAFAARWNPVARQYGLKTYQRSQL
jgi:hypothetical protein